MPHKFNADRRDKIPKQKQRVTNWAEYNEGLRRRGDLTIWISEDAIGLWLAARRTTRSGQRRYSNLAIELCLTLGMVFKQPLQQTLGLDALHCEAAGSGERPDQACSTIPLPSFCKRRGLFWLALHTDEGSHAFVVARADFAASAVKASGIQCATDTVL